MFTCKNKFSTATTRNQLVVRLYKNFQLPSLNHQMNIKYPRTFHITCLLVNHACRCILVEHNNFFLSHNPIIYMYIHFHMQRRRQKHSQPIRAFSYIHDSNHISEYESMATENILTIEKKNRLKESPMKKKKKRYQKPCSYTDC